MFTTDSGYGWKATPEPIGTVTLDGRTITLSHRGIANLADRIAAGQTQDTAIKAVLYPDPAERLANGCRPTSDFGYDVMGWWVYKGKKNPWRAIGRVQITRTVEYGKVHYCATSLITDHTSPTLAHLLSRLTREQFGAAKPKRDQTKKARRRKPARVLSDGEVWARRAEEGWGPGGY